MHGKHARRGAARVNVQSASPTTRHAARGNVRVSPRVWFIAGACTVLAVLSIVTVLFSGGTNNGPHGTSPSRLVYVHGAGNSNSVGTLTVRVHDSADTFVNYAIP